MRFYTVEYEIEISTHSDGDGLLIIEAPSDLIVIVTHVAVYNFSLDISQMFQTGFYPITDKGSLSGFATPAIRKHDNGDVDSTVTTYGSNTNGMTVEPTTWGDPYDEQGWNIASGYEYNPPAIGQGRGIIISPSGLAGIRVIRPVTPFFSKSIIIFAELGG